MTSSPATRDPHALFASVDLGGTKIACVLAEADGRTLAEGTTPTNSYEGPAGVLGRIATLVNQLADKLGRKPAALGMGVPGLADLATGATRFLPNLVTQWRDVQVRDILVPQIGCPVYLLNDVRMAALGELQYGHGRTVSNFLFYALGTGVGGGIVQNGRMLLGRLGACGEFGHMSVDPFGPRCGCGNRGCLELFISGPALTGEGVRLLLSGNAPRLHALTGGDIGKVNVKLMSEAANTGDDRVRESIVRSASYLGVGIANTVTTLHPQLIVLGGGVAGIGPLLFDTVRAAIRERVGMFPTDDIRVEPSQLGDKAGALGGIALALRGGLVGE